MRRALLTAAGLAALAASIPLALAGRTALHPSLKTSPLQPVAAAYAEASASPAQAPSDLPLRLARLSAGIRSAHERAQAEVVVGAALALPAGNGSVGFDAVRQVGGGRLLDQAAGEFRAAALLDDTNEAAKYDLELLLKSLPKPQAAQRQQRRSRQRSGQKVERRRRVKHARGSREQHAAGTSAPGSGY